MGAEVRDEMIADLPIRALFIWCDACGKEFATPIEAIFFVREHDRQIWLLHAGACSNAIFAREHPTGGGLLEQLLDYIGIF
jgi:hypothetical protein